MKQFVAFYQKSLEDGDEPDHVSLQGNCSDFESNRITDFYFREMLLPCFQKVKFVKSIDISNQTLGDLGMVDICFLLKSNVFIRKINLKGNDITSAGAKLIADLLVTNETLKDINISYNEIGDEGLFAIANSLQVNQGIEVLSVAGCGIGNKSFIALCTVLHANELIHTLDLSDNQSKLSTLTQSTLFNVMSHLCIMLKTNTSITTLNLSKLGITDWIVGDLLADALGSSAKLSDVNLSGNRIGQDGGCAIFKALAGNSYMRRLNMNNCSVREAGAKELSRLLITNNSLKQIDLQHNSISCKGLISIAEGLKLNNALKVINLWGNHFAEPSCEVYSLLQGGSSNTKIGSNDDEISKELIEKIRSKTNFKPVISVKELLHSDKRNANARLGASSTDFEIYRVENRHFASRIAAGGILSEVEM